MTDERLCKCGHYQHLGRCAISECPCGAGGAAPSTDEGEVRVPVRLCAVCEGEITASSGEWWIPEQILHVEGGEPHRAVYVRDWQAAAIRAPLEERIRAADQRALFWENATAASVVTLEQERVERRAAEERIRELEAVAFHTDGIMHIATERIETLGAEVESLREALDAIGWHVSPESLIGRIVHGALATPPSSTEGAE